MALYERLIGLEFPRIPVHQFCGALAELERQTWTRQNVIDAFGLSASEEVELDTLTAKIIALPEAYPLGAFVTLTNVGSTFDSSAAAKGLGFVAVDTAGITRAEIRIRYNKIGTGTLTWQLWNETDGVSLGTATDAVAGDNKIATIIATPAQPLSNGVKLVRPRVQSSVATDDPVYYGACLFVRRVARITAADLHEVLLLADGKVAPYNTAAAVKARLGV